MAKVTSKLQLTLPKELAKRYNIVAGDDVEWIAAGDAIRIVRVKTKPKILDTKQRLRLFDKVTKRLAARKTSSTTESQNRGWTREELYTRGSID